MGAAVGGVLWGLLWGGGCYGGCRLWGDSWDWMPEGTETRPQKVPTPVHSITHCHRDRRAGRRTLGYMTALIFHPHINCDFCPPPPPPHPHYSHANLHHLLPTLPPPPPSPHPTLPLCRKYSVLSALPRKCLMRDTDKVRTRRLPRSHTT